MLTNLALAQTRDKLAWFEELGFGYLEAQPNGVYDQAYFDKYRQMRSSKIGSELNKFRVALTKDYLREGESIIDVGIGDGAFIEALQTATITPYGFDVNPASISWLREKSRYASLYDRKFDVATFWDSLEHIRDPRYALEQVSRVAIISIPIFDDVKHVLRSKHYRPDEHYWYFTERGFIEFLSKEGFQVVRRSNMEIALGREDIGTFVAVRV